MASLPNLAKDTAKRLKNDDSWAINILFARDGVAVDVSAKQYSVGFCTPGTMDEKLTLAVGSTSIVRPANTTDRISLDLSVLERSSLTADSYSVYVFEQVGGRRRPRFWFAFELLKVPDSYDATRPEDPADLLLNFSSIIGTASLSLLYQLSGSVPGALPGYASEAEGTSGNLPGGASGTLFCVGNKLYFRNANGLFGVALTAQDS